MGGHSDANCGRSLSYLIEFEESNVVEISVLIVENHELCSMTLEYRRDSVLHLLSANCSLGCRCGRHGKRG